MLNKLQLQILPELQLQNLDQPCAQSLNKSLALGPNVSSQIFNKLLPTRSSASTWATVTTSTSFELASSHARVTSIKFTKQEWVSESVSDKHSQWSDSGPIIKSFPSREMILLYPHRFPSLSPLPHPFLVTSNAIVSLVIHYYDIPSCC